MGATLGCFRGGPDADVDAVAARYYAHGVHGAKRSSSYAMLQMREEKSVLSKLQRTLSLSLLKSRSEAPSSGRRTSNSSSSHVFTRDSTSARSSRDDDGLSEYGSWDLTRSYSSASGTSGSRMLSDFYNLVLESERSTFFKDKHGKRVKGAYLDDVRIIEDYFGPTTRKRQRMATAAGAAAQREAKLPILDRYAHVPSALMSTSSTISSELDYWSCLDSMMATEQDELALPRRYDMTAATLNGRLLFSPMHAAAAAGSSNDATARRLSKSLSPHPSSVWTSGYSAQFHDDHDDDHDDDSDDDSDDDDSDDVGSKSATHYSHSQLHRSSVLVPTAVPRHKKLVESSTSSAATAAVAASAPASSSVSIYFTPNAAQNERAVTPTMAS